MSNMHKEDPSPGSFENRSAIFYLGRDRHGRWIVQDADHLRGGMFINEAAARKFALGENGNRHEAIVSLAGIVELDFSSTPLRHESAGAQLPKAA
ncbi:hypothetical protein [Bradyrhizobium sp. LHD-71]|uniref:hypothetical protein n=1 Tax=Bradyrhizobium sp. LHD-71 TaxID=3072141 RepID=UPI0028102646|nr:hypothetical protein [Bradyrhizobium sp. LHD-71]MDQ8727715.1 hypothetical protein [Bradyrhizobium sp. LHD-71]